LGWLPALSLVSAWIATSIALGNAGSLAGSSHAGIRVLGWIAFRSPPDANRHKINFTSAVTSRADWSCSLILGLGTLSG